MDKTRNPYMVKFLRIISSIFFCLLALSFFLALIENCKSLLNAPKNYFDLIIGFVIYFLLNRFNISFIRANMQWMRVFSHELIHVFVSLLSLKKINSMEATQFDGGKVTFFGKSNLLISLAPYSFPLFTIILLLLRPLIKTIFLFYFNILIGLTYAFHLHTFYLQINKNQPDFQDQGVFQSYSFTIMLNLYFFGAILLSEDLGLYSFIQFFKDGISIYAFLF